MFVIRQNTEQEARSLIDFTLKKLAWKFDGINQNIFQESPKSYAEKKKLGSLRPDYILYNGELPIAIIEAKSKNGNFQKAKKNGFKKARLINCPIVFISDYDFIEAYKVDKEEKLFRNERPLNHFLKLNDLIKYKTESSINDENIIKSNKDLQNIFSRANGILHSCGFQIGMPRLVEFYNILFIKLLFDIENNTGEKNVIGLGWQDLLERQGEDLINTFNSLIERYNRNYNNLLKEKDEKLSAKNLKAIINLINDAGNLSKVDTDIKGEAFEYFLRKYQDNHNDLAQYFTPRHIVKFIVWLAKPKLGDKIFDPFCGTGGMLIEAFKYIKNNHSKLSKQELNKLKNDTVWGQDNSDSSKIAKMNMILAGDGHCNIERKDTLETEAIPNYDFVITNIPFNLKPRSFENNKYFINFCFNSLNNKGKAFVISPYSIMEDNYKEFRKKLEPYLEKLIKLPKFTFSPYTNATSLILVLNKKKQSNHIEYIEIKDDGFSKNKLRELEKDSDIEKIQRGELNFISINNFNKLENTNNITDGVKLIDFLIPQDRMVELEPSKTYCEPSISGKTNTISIRKKRLGKNIRAKRKKLILKDDLVIATLHTQDGLFGIADREYIGTSQLVYKINTEKITKEELFYLLNREIRKLSTEDVVGRETYKQATIENTLLPKLTDKIKERVRLINNIKKEIKKMQEYLKKLYKDN